MEDELKCLHCKTFFINPVLLPCSHSMCLSCALAAQTPFQAPLQSHVVGSGSSGGGGSGSGSISAGSCASSGHNTSADSSSCNNSDTASVCGGSSEHGDGEFSDKLSVVSETDSGVICCGGSGTGIGGGTSSRPNSFIGTAQFRGLSLAGGGGGILSPAPQVLCSLSLVCPVCRKLVYFDENGARNLPRNKALANVVLRYTASLGAGISTAAGSPASGTPTLSAARSGLAIDAVVSSTSTPSSSSDATSIPCQLCEGPPSSAAVLCEQCEIYYCQTCQQSCHPSRGPLAQHNLVPVLQDCWSSLSSPTVSASASSTPGVVSLRRTPSSLTRSGFFASSNAFSPSQQHRTSAGIAAVFDPASPTVTKCPEHLTETLSLYCTVCKWPVCCLCIQDSPRHANHDVQSLSSISKAHKVRRSFCCFCACFGCWKRADVMDRKLKTPVFLLYPVTAPSWNSANLKAFFHLSSCGRVAVGRKQFRIWIGFWQSSLEKCKAVYIQLGTHLRGG